jgi:hypothetical protein
MAYAYWLNFVENFPNTHVKPPKLLEKLKNLEVNPRKFWHQYLRISEYQLLLYYVLESILVLDFGRIPWISLELRA